MTMLEKKLSTIEAEALVNLPFREMQRMLVRYGEEDLTILQQAFCFAWEKRRWVKAHLIRLRMAKVEK